MQFLIGVDIGTQSTGRWSWKRRGRIVSQAAKETELIYEGEGGVWQEPDRMYQDCTETVRAAARKGGNRAFPGLLLYLHGRPNGGNHGNRKKRRGRHAI